MHSNRTQLLVFVTTTMSLPRSDYDPRRVCLNPFPDFNLNLGKHRRTIGIYLAGALVCISSQPIVSILTACPCAVRPCKLDIP